MSSSWDFQIPAKKQDWFALKLKETLTSGYWWWFCLQTSPGFSGSTANF